MFPVIGFTDAFFPKPTHPPEDSFLISKKFPIYAVADGVTLQIPEGQKYPRSSGAKKVADIFCKNSVQFLEKNWHKSNQKKNLENAFQYSNNLIKNFNQKTKLPHKPFSTTAAIFLIKNSFLFGARLCDAGIAILHSNGEIKFKTPEFWTELKRKGQTKYGVLNGSEQVLKFIDFYKIKLNKGDIVIIYTDGFENYFALNDFLKIFGKWNNADNIFKKLKFLSKKMPSMSLLNSKLYGHERTLIAIKFICPTAR